jgi:hypothetical protein
VEVAETVTDSVMLTRSKLAARPGEVLLVRVTLGAVVEVARPSVALWRQSQSHTAVTGRQDGKKLSRPLHSSQRADLL